MSANRAPPPPPHQIPLNPRDPRPRDRAVGRVREARLRDEPHERHRRLLEVVGVVVEIAPQLRVRDGHRVGQRRGPHRQHRDGRGIVLVLVGLPQLGVGHVDVGGEVLRQLHLRDAIAIDRLDLREDRPVGAALQEPLPLGDVELPVGLELRVAEHFGGRRRAGRLDDLLGRHRDPQTAVRLLQQDLLDQLTHHLVLDLLLVFPRERYVAALLAELLVRALHALLPFGDLDFAAVHLEDDVCAGAEDLQHLAERQPHDERPDEDDEDVLGVRAHHAQHEGVSAPEREGVKGHKSKNDNAQTQATGVAV
jgi:hypothetical protein